MRRLRKIIPAFGWRACLRPIVLLAGIGFAASVGWAQPANDNFINAIVVGGNYGTTNGDDTGATAEIGEPNHAGLPPGLSIWYAWTAPLEGPVQFDTYGSSIDINPAMGVYTGSNVSHLSLVAANDDVNPTAPGTWIGPAGVRFNAKAGTTYYIAITDLTGVGGAISLSWAYHSAGVFRVGRDNYAVSEVDMYAGISSTVSPSQTGGAWITVVRQFGSSGRVQVDYATADGVALAGVDYQDTSGTLIFEDWEMSKTFLVPVFDDLGLQQDIRDFTVTLTATTLDPLESTDVAPPRIDPAHAVTAVTINDFDIYPFPVPFDTPVIDQPVVQLEKTFLRTREDVVNGVATVYVLRVGGDATKSWRIGYTMISANFVGDWMNNGFRTRAGSDYATPDPETLTPPGLPPSDFIPVSGILSWGANDFNPKPINITILNDTLVEFNEDIFIQLYQPTGTDVAVPGYNSTANLTILYDEYPAGALDDAYNQDFALSTVPPNNTHPGANSTVYALAVQGDNKTIIGGDFTAYNTIARNYVARINVDGSNDGSFNPGSGANAFISSLKLAGGGKIVIGGAFTGFNGTYRYRIARLNGDGSLDNAFNPGLGADDTVWMLAVQSDDKVVIGGDFLTVDGQARPRIARLNADGTVDPTFDPGAGPNSTVNAVVLQSDGKVIIGGDFTIVNGVPRAHIARLNADGTVDTSFDPGAGVDGPVYTIKLQTDSAVLIGGAFDFVDLRPRRNYARLNSNGSLDTTFVVGTGADDVVYTINTQGDGKIYLGGLFDTINGTRRVGLARLFPSGEVDTSFLDTAYNHFAGITVSYFDPAITPKSFLFDVGVQSDGNIMIAGGFTRVGGGRLNPTIQPLVPDTQTRTRAAYRNRNNVARLLGGTTGGPGSIGFAYDTYSVDENLTSLYVTVVRSNGTLGQLSANFTVPPRVVGPGVAQSGVDYLFSNLGPYYDSTWPSTRTRSDGYFGANNVDQNVLNSASIPPTALNDITITVLDDTILQGNRTAPFMLDTPSGADTLFLGGENIPALAALAPRSTAELSVLDNDAKPGTIGFTSVIYTVNENGTNAVITLNRTNGITGSVTVRFSTLTGGSATPGVDYTPATNTVTFGNLVSSRTVIVPLILNDTTIEPDETVLLRLSNPGNGVAIGVSNATLTIIDDDFLPGRLNFSAPTYSTNEDVGSIRLTVTRTGGNLGVLTVQYATSNSTATAGSDYTGVTNTLSWNNGDTSSRTITIPLTADTVVEPDETFFVRLFNPSAPGALGSQVNVPVTIVNDDFYGKVQFSTANYIVNENGGSAIITAVRTGGSAESVSVNFSASPGTAVPGYHFDPTNGTLSFGPGEVSKSFTVSIFDNVDQDGSRFIALTLAGASPAGTLGTPSTALLTILDDETLNEPPGSLDTAYNQSAAFNEEVDTLALQSDGKLMAGGNFTMVNGLVRNRIARINQDGSLDQTFLNALGGVNGVVRSLVNQTDDRVVIGGGFTGVNGVNRNGIARLNFDGTLDTSFNPGSGTDNPVQAVAEAFVGNVRKILIGGGFTTVNGVSRRGIARLNDDGVLDTAFNPNLGVDGVVYAIAVQTDGKTIIGGDFTAVNGTARGRIARLNLDGSLDVTFDPGTGANDPVRAVALQLDGRVLIGGSFTNFNGTEINRITRLNANGAMDPTFTPGVGANESVNSITIQGDTKIILGGQFTRCNGVSRNHLTRLNNDGTVDPTINFGAGANNFVAASVVQADNRIIIGGGFTQYDSQPRVRIARIYGGSIAGSGTFEFTAGDYQVGENATNVVITVRRRGGTAGQPAPDSITVDAVMTDVTAINGLHYLGGTRQLVFPPGEVFQSFTVQIIDDFEVNADRTFNLSLENITPPGSAGLGFQPTATVTIVNDDAAISFSAANYARSESSINSAATITVVRNGSTSGTATVDVATTTNGTATAGVDYVAITNLTLTFLPGETQKTFIVPIIPDTLIEGDETVSLQLSNVIGALVLIPFQATLTIVDDDSGPGQIAFASIAYTATENGGNAVISLARTNGRNGLVTVNLRTSDITAIAGLDYTAFNNSVSFGEGETNKSVLIPILDDAFVEGNETFLVTLTNATGGATILGPNTAPVTIIDNDVGVTLSSPVYVVGEGAGSVTISVLRINSSNGVATVQYATTNGTATAGSDYTGTSGTLTFNDGETLKTFAIPISEDTSVEGDETFTVFLFNPSVGVQSLSASAVVTIVDNDTAFGFAPTTYVVDEGVTNALLTVIRTNASTGPASVAFSSSNLTATAGADYTAVGGVLTFTNGENIKTIVVPIVNDTQVEGDESFQVTLSNPGSGAQLLGATVAVVTITDNDAGVKFSSPTYTVTENGVQATITVLRTTVTNSIVGVNYLAANGTATNGQDYTGVSGNLVFGIGEVSKSFTVPIIDDTLEEGAETVFLSLSSPTGQLSLLSPNSAVLTIVDNDGGSILPAGVLLTAESIAVNGAIDPGETVTGLFALRNVSGLNTTNLVATLLSTNGITSPSGPQNYGALADGGVSVSRSFSFTANATNGATIFATFQVQDGPINLGRVTFAFLIGSGTVTVSNTALITIADNAPASPYPAVITVSGVPGTVSKVTATLSNLSHAFPDDIDILLVGPTAANTILMSDVGGNNFITNVTLTIDDAAANSLPDSSVLTSGTYKPTNFSPDTFPSSAPPAPWGSVLSPFNGSNPNGNWSLFVVDDQVGGSGSITRGWSLNITTTGVIPAASDLSLKVTVAPDPGIVGSNLTYTIVVTNHGPWTATGVTLTNTIPAGATFVSASQSPGSISTNSGSVVWTIGTLAKDAVASATITVRPGVVGSAVATTYVFASESDPNTANNIVTTTTTVSPLTADLALGVVDAPDPLYIGAGINLVYTITLTNLGPATATGVAITNTLPPNLQFISATPAGYTRVGNVVTFTNLGNLNSGAQTGATITVRPLVPDTLTNTTTAGSAAIFDPFKGNNVISVKTLAELPQAAITRTGNNLVISWPSAAANYVLDRTTSLTPPIIWTPVTVPAPVTVGDQKTVTVPLTGGNEYFRLRAVAP